MESHPLSVMIAPAVAADAPARVFQKVAVGAERGPAGLVPIYRQLCPGCGLTVSLVPAFIKPFHRPCLHDLERVVDLYVEGTPNERLAEEVGVEALA